MLTPSFFRLRFRPNASATGFSGCNSTKGSDYTYLCGERSLANFLRDGSLIHIASIRPNAAQDELSVELQSLVTQDATIEIFDALGVIVYTDIRTVASGESSIHLDTKSLPSGVYILRLNGVSQTFIKVK